MIPILYEHDEAGFTSNGIGRLRDCISCIVTEERNGIYECDFEYPVDGANYELIKVGRIVGVTHDESGDIQPFDIVGFEKPIDGIVTFHCVHVSYRQTRMTVTGSNINSLSAAFTLFGNAQPSNPFNYWTDKTSTGFLASADGIPHSVREMLGGMEGSVLDAYGGEYEWDRWQVKLWSNRGQYRDFSIRYGVNMLEYNDEYDSQSSYSSCIPYWTDGENTVIGSRQDCGALTPSGRGECVPLDVSDKFEDQPTQAQVEAAGLSYMTGNNTYNPKQTINVSFVRLQDMGEFADFQNLLQCKLCDTINVIFPDYNSSGSFKIVKTEWNVLTGKYESMELGELSTTLAEALNITPSSSYSGSGGGGLANLVDGSATGSVRGVDTATEDANYTIGTDAFAEGYDTEASGANSHAEGNSTVASGTNSHAEGWTSKAKGGASHAEGDSTADGDYSHSGGRNTHAYSRSQTVIGELNVDDTAGTASTLGTYAFIVGNGTSNNAKSNALTVGWDGEVTSPSGHMNSTDMTTGSGGEVETFVNGLNVSGGGVITPTTTLSDFITLASGFSGSNFNCRKWGSLLSVSFAVTRNVQTTANSTINIGTIKSPYLPIIISSVGGASYRGVIATSGEIYLRPYETVGANSAENIVITYLVQ